MPPESKLFKTGRYPILTLKLLLFLFSHLAIFTVLTCTQFFKLRNLKSRLIFLNIWAFFNQSPRSIWGPHFSTLVFILWLRILNHSQQIHSRHWVFSMQFSLPRPYFLPTHPSSFDKLLLFSSYLSSKLTFSRKNNLYISVVSLS